MSAVIQYLIKMPKKLNDRCPPLSKEQKTAKMKKLPQQELIDLLSGDSEVEEVHFPIQQKQSHRTLEQSTKQAPSAIAHPPSVSPPQTQICLVCLDQDFQAGRYMLDCAHCFCSDCIKHWESVSDRCPVCHQRATSVLSIYAGESRLKKVNFEPTLQPCGKCNSSNNYHLMYFCDECDEACVHTYCESSLREEGKSEKWICEHCIYSNYYENRYNEESASEDVQEISREDAERDSFVVEDDVIEYYSRSNDLDEEEPTVKRPKNYTHKHNGRKKPKRP